MSSYDDSLEFSKETDPAHLLWGELSCHASSTEGTGLQVTSHCRLKK